MSRKQWGHGFYRGVKTAQLENKTLVGLYFHTQDKEGKIEWQGVVTKCLSDTQYVVQLFSWWDGMPTIQKIVSFENMEKWDFYASDKTMRWQYAKESGQEGNFEHSERIIEMMKKDDIT